MFLHRKLKNQWPLIPILATTLLILLSGSFMINKSSANLPIEKVYFIPKTTEAAVPLKYVTKSLSELGKMDEINRNVLLINQVPYCGAEVLIFLLQKLQGFNNYRHVRIKGGATTYSDSTPRLSEIQQEEFVDGFYDLIREKAVPLSFDRQIYFINFTRFDKQSPTYINIIREPADKILSRSLYRRDGGRNRRNANLMECIKQGEAKCQPNINADDRTVPYFCGQDPRCRSDSKWALARAKLNVDRYYPVVGVLEELNSTLEVLEHKFPYFFQGVQQLYHTQMIGKINKKRESQSKRKLEKQLRKMLQLEYDFYDWIKSRLFQQIQILYGEHNSH